jgi:lipoprotein-anchoring transpeptidase ErfK/SrfK
MKKIIFFSLLTSLLFCLAGTGFAADPAAEDATDRTLAALESPKSPVAAEAENADKDAFKEDDFFVDEVKHAPVAVVSAPEAKESAEAVAKPVTAKSKPVAAKDASNAVPVGDKKKTEVSSEPTAQEMQKRWKALFSKEITPDSISYVVKPGDSLYVIARKNHTTVDLIKKINALKGDNIYPKMKLKIHTAPFSIVVDKSRNTLVLYSKGAAVKKYSVATGKKNCTPVGEFKITDKLVNPTWFKTGAILPPGSPKNALGTRWMGFDKPAYGIHGTIEPKSIGTQASEGCIRMLNEEVEELYSLVPTGTKVTIQD